MSDGGEVLSSKAEPKNCMALKQYSALIIKTIIINRVVKVSAIKRRLLFFHTLSNSKIRPIISRNEAISKDISPGRNEVASFTKKVSIPVFTSVRASKRLTVPMKTIIKADNRVKHRFKK